jgi:hypothetical protein
VRISTIALDTLLELVRGQVFQELGEDGLSGIHPSFSAIHAPCAYAVLALASAPGNSNRKTRVIYYRAYYVMVTADRPNVNTPGRALSITHKFSSHEDAELDVDKAC